MKKLNYSVSWKQPYHHVADAPIVDNMSIEDQLIDHPMTDALAVINHIKTKL